MLVILIFLFYCSAAHLDLHSFPTRRSSDLRPEAVVRATAEGQNCGDVLTRDVEAVSIVVDRWISVGRKGVREQDRKSTRLNSSHPSISYAVFCLKKKNKNKAVGHYNHDTLK